MGLTQGGPIRRWGLLKGAYLEMGLTRGGLIQRWGLLEGGLFGDGAYSSRAYSEVGFTRGYTVLNDAVRISTASRYLTL